MPLAERSLFLLHGKPLQHGTAADTRLYHSTAVINHHGISSALERHPALKTGDVIECLIV